MSPIESPANPRAKDLLSALSATERGARTTLYASLAASLAFLYFCYSILAFDTSRVQDLQTEAGSAKEMYEEARDYVDLVGNLRSSQRSFPNDFSQLLKALYTLQSFPLDSIPESTRIEIAEGAGVAPDSLGRFVIEGLGAGEAMFSYGQDPKGNLVLYMHNSGVWDLPNREMRHAAIRFQDHFAFMHALNFYYDNWRLLHDPETIGLMLHPIPDPNTVHMQLPVGRTETLSDYRRFRNRYTPAAAAQYCQTKGLTPTVRSLESYSQKLDALVASLKRNEVGTVKLPIISESVVLPFVFLVANPLLAALVGMTVLQLYRRQAIAAELQSLATSDTEAMTWDLARHPWLGTVSAGSWDPRMGGLLATVILIGAALSNTVAPAVYWVRVGFTLESLVGITFGLMFGVLLSTWLVSVWRSGLWHVRIYQARRA